MIRKILKFSAFFLLFFFAVGISAYVTLTLIIKGENAVIVPDLRHQNIVTALETLTDLGLNTKIKGSEYNNDIPKNHIIFQDPEPGAEIKKGRDVHIIISKGAEKVLMPRLRSLKRQQAHIIIEENDLCIGAESYIHSALWDKNRIVAQWPPSGQKLSRNACVDLLISLGEPPVFFRMPDLTGLLLDEAVFRLEPFGLQIGEIKTTHNPGMPDNVIAVQNPPDGFRVQQGGIIQFTINRKKDDSRKPEISAIAGGVRLFRFHLKPGFLKKRIRVRVNCFGLSNDFYNAVTRPGSEIWSLVPRYTDASLFVYEDDILIKTEIFDDW